MKRMAGEKGEEQEEEKERRQVAPQQLQARPLEAQKARQRQLQWAALRLEQEPPLLQLLWPLVGLQRQLLQRRLELLLAKPLHTRTVWLWASAGAWAPLGPPADLCAVDAAERDASCPHLLAWLEE